MAVKKVILIRHGETDYNRDRRLQGALPVPLNKNGRLQAEALGDVLCHYSIDAIFSSSLLRAQQTAELIAQQIEKPVHLDPRLHEVLLGKFQGLTMTQVKQQFPEEYRMWRSGDMTYAIPEGESRLMVQKRMAMAWQEIVASDQYKTVAMISHGSALKILLRHLFYYLFEIKMSNTAITILSRYQHAWEVESLAITPHLNNQAE